eukprot:m.41574 g.41574  ORF g.41574 m.41574 type:complete len:78 (-) comp10582_c0_seq1:257-490(-)
MFLQLPFGLGAIKGHLASKVHALIREGLNAPPPTPFTENKPLLPSFPTLVMLSATTTPTTHNKAAIHHDNIITPTCS